MKSRGLTWEEAQSLKRDKMGSRNGMFPCAVCGAEEKGEWHDWEGEKGYYMPDGWEIYEHFDWHAYNPQGSLSSGRHTSYICPSCQRNTR